MSKTRNVRAAQWRRYQDRFGFRPNHLHRYDRALTAWSAHQSHALQAFNALAARLGTRYLKEGA